MARTQAADYEQRREAIVERAADLFAEFGFRGASVSDLAKACQTSKSLIYHYYPSKEDVLYAVMLSHIDQLVEDVETVMALDKPPHERLRHLLRSFMAHYIGAASRQKVLLNELSNLPDDKRRSIIGKQRIVIEAVQSLIVAIDPAMAADPAKARVQTMLLFGMINWTKTWFSESGTISAQKVADMAFDLMSPAC
ncbi:TetR/AcrR family transcriptional regulator [Sphingobium sp. SCG-1]|uniref:TetR/AcrR family transcriptional regulator n=1 Tax=Sphingobium sp. SCG-1 TaxID=2072936 RepID=UPI000CD6B3E6|nr:TetR/AcrR family transcriptional regulator [Sphingobium sp. SCG-1]AUW58781.1 TetR/AcrR family transcriptional regulator [Sphingobium sp. SCG-1]